MSKLIGLRVSDGFYGELQARAKISGLSLSGYIREVLEGEQLVVGRPPVEPHSGFDPESDDPRRSSLSQAKVKVQKMNPAMKRVVESLPPGKGKRLDGTLVSLGKPK